MSIERTHMSATRVRAPRPGRAVLRLPHRRPGRARDLEDPAARARRHPGLVPRDPERLPYPTPRASRPGSARSSAVTMPPNWPARSMPHRRRQPPGDRAVTPWPITPSGRRQVRPAASVSRREMTAPADIVAPCSKSGSSSSIQPPWCEPSAAAVTRRVRNTRASGPFCVSRGIRKITRCAGWCAATAATSTRRPRSSPWLTGGPRSLS